MSKAQHTPILHFAVSVQKYGEERIRSLCNRSRSDVVNIDSVDVGQNVTFDSDHVTCKFCLRILAARPAIAKAKGE